MKRQIISRAFYGWLAYCRHLSTVRTHLSGLVHSAIVCQNETDSGITVEKWKKIMNNGVVTNSLDVFKLTYFGGVEHSLRKQVRKYILYLFFFV